MYIYLHLKYPLFLSDLNEANFLDSFSKNTEISNSMKILQVGSDLFHEDRQTGGRKDRRTDGRTDVAKLVVAFRNCSNAPKKMVLMFVYSVITTYIVDI